MPLVRRSSIFLAVMSGLVAVATATAAPAFAAVNQQDRTWLTAAHQANLAEIAAGHSAQQHATSATVRQIGQMLITDHTRMDNQLTAAATQLDVSLPDSPTNVQQQQLAAVESHQGDAYDSAWITSQITGHRATLAATQKEIADGSDPQVLNLARSATPVVEHRQTGRRWVATQQ